MQHELPGSISARLERLRAGLAGGKIREQLGLRRLDPERLAELQYAALRSRWPAGRTGVYADPCSRNASRLRIPSSMDESDDALLTIFDAHY